jgi:hypothetical protein
MYVSIQRPTIVGRYVTLLLKGKEGKIVPVLNYVIKHYATKTYGGVGV